MDDGSRSTVFRALALAALVPLAGACAHVSQDDFDATIADVRQEMREGDAAVEARLNGRIDALEERLNVVVSDLAVLEEEFDVTVERLETAIRLVPPVHFGFDSAELTGSDTPALDRFAELMRKEEPGARVTVEGFTDPAGSQAYNLRLGQRRADAVRDYLVARGLNASAFRTVSYGEDTRRLVRPDAAGPGVEGRENRRVVIVLDYAPESQTTVAQSGS